MSAGFDFGVALHALKNGKRVRRLGWNSPNQWVYYVPGGEYKTQTPVARAVFGETATYRPYFAIKTVQGDVATWTPSTSDALAEDWIMVEGDQ